MLEKVSEVCPACGDFAVLNSFTGWCSTCSSNVERRCVKCEDKLPEYDSHSTCRKCRHAIFLEKNGDSIDRCLAEGLTVNRALKLLKQENRKALSCYRCKGPLKPATRGERYFCNKESCRKANNRMRRLMYVKGYSRDKALQEVLRSLNASNSAAA